MGDSAVAAVRPLPLEDDISAGFWAAARERRLDIQYCSSCSRWNHTPSLTCPNCGSEDLAFRPASGRGLLYAWTVLHEPPAPGFRDMVPLIVGVVELEEQPRLFITTNILGATVEQLRLGAPVEVMFEEVSDAVLPQFRLVGE